MNGFTALRFEPAVAPSSTLARGHADIPALTGLRFLAAFSVAVAHAADNSFRIANPSALFNEIKFCFQVMSGFGMTLFFVLSGFVIHYNYRTPISSRRVVGFFEFMWARFSRLYPLFIVMLIVDLLLGSRTYQAILAGQDAIIPALTALPYFLTLTQSWVYAVPGDHSLIYQIGDMLPLTWSISTEWFFYLCYPAVMLVVILARKPFHVIGLAIAWTVLWASFASGLAAHSSELDAWAMQHFGAMASVAHGTQDNFVRWLFYFSPYLRIGEFILGCMAAQLYLVLENKKTGPRERDIAFAAVIVAIVSIPVLLYLLFSPSVGTVSWLRRLNNNYGLAPSVAVLLFCAARYNFSALRWLSSRLILRFGEASYSIYLTHMLIFVLITNSQGPLPAGWHSILFLYARFILMLGFVLLVSTGLFACIEDPVRRMLRALWSRSGFPVWPWALASAPIVAAVVAVVAVVVVNSYAAAPSASSASGISIVSATYGGNCGAPSGNATQSVAAACGGKADCGYTVDVARLGDPAPNCGKDFAVAYSCASDRTTHYEKVPGEAGLGDKQITLSCRSAQPAASVRPAQ